MKKSQERYVYWLESIQPNTWIKPEQQLHFPAGSPLLVYIDRGELRIRAEGKQWEVQAGELVYLDGSRTDAVASAGKSGACLVLRIQALYLCGEPDQWTTKNVPNIAFIKGEGPLPIPGGKRLREQIAALSGCGPDDRDWAFQKLLRLLYEELKDASAEARCNGGIEQSIEYMHNHYHEKISRETLAHIAGLAPNSYWRSFKRLKGISPNAYLQQIRVEHAKARLSEGMPLKEAAEASGFGNEFYLSRVFKKWTGLSPSLFVKRHTLKVAVASRFLYQNSLQALGIEPVLAVDCYKHPLTSEEEYEARLLRQTAELRSAAPDLIIGDFSHAEHLGWMKTIAPTVIIPHSLEWRTPFLHIADLIGRRREAERMIVQVEDQVALHAERIASRKADQTFSMMQIMHDHIMVQGTVSHPLNELIYGELKLKPDPNTPAKEMRQYLQSQDVPAFTSDCICVRLYKEHPQVIEMWDRLRQLPFWPDLPAVRNGHVHLTGNWLVESWTPQGRVRIAEDIARMIVPD